MGFRLTFLTGLSLLFMATGLYLAFAGADGDVGKRYFFTTLGILGWFIGNRLVELEERITELEEASLGLRDRGVEVPPRAQDVADVAPPIGSHAGPASERTSPEG
jgi:hypothetical protein